MKIALVGAGPGNIYTGISLLKYLNVKIDVFDPLPTPFGLVRSGVAPDHQTVKNVTAKFNDFLKMENVSYYGGLSLQDLSLRKLKKAYHAVVLGYGSGLTNTLKITSAFLEKKGKGVYSSSKIVGWYNGKPSREHIEWEIPETDSAIIIGNGNVALDIARIFLKDVEELKSTDITKHALEFLSKSKIKNVHIVGRRGAVEAAFTTKELRELAKIKGLRMFANMEYLNDTISQNVDLLKKDRAKKRLLDLLISSVGKEQKEYDKSIYFHFKKSPVEIMQKDNMVNGIVCERNEIKEGKAFGTREFDKIFGGLVVTAIGSKGEQLDPDIPWDNSRCIVPNLQGRAVGNDGFIPGLYVSGWLKTGPVGTIATTLLSAQETASCIIEDNEMLLSNQLSATVEDLLKDVRKEYVNFKGWNRIDNFEVSYGEKIGKVREKIVSIDQMYSVANS